MAAGIDKEDMSRTFCKKYDGNENFNDFYNFCSFVLAYEEHIITNTPLKLDGTVVSVGINSNVESRSQNMSNTSSDSESSNEKRQTIGKRKHSEESVQENESDSDYSSSNDEYESDDESWNLVTCYCGRPFAGRPMIECSKCLTWIHLYCARIKKDNVPEYFLCQNCKKKKSK